MLVGLVLVGDVGHERIIGVGIGQERADGKKHLGDGECGAPLLLENVEANTTVRINVRVIDACREVDLWWLERVIGGEVNVEEVDTAGIRAVIRSHDGCLPVELIFLVNGTS